MPGLGDYTLGGLVERLGLTPEVIRLCPTGRWHDALFDSVASLVLVRHVIESCGLAGEPVDVLVNGKLIARGEVVVIDESFGIRVTEVVSRAERIRSMGV